ncbi:hypothetical protein ACI4BE_27625, partial [Klebsiella pneumoniae]|uniref:hypothetical protein n=1 Tax=Klebsiella pneumoniae TaxID=573 RepID=UPI0038551A33
MNHVTIDQFIALPLGERAAVPLDQLALLQDEIASADLRAKAAKMALDGALLHRFGDRAQAMRRAA